MKLQRLWAPASLLAFGCALASAPQASAHHSTAMFDMDHMVSLNGTVKEFQWTQPHTEIAPGVGHSDQVHIVERIHQVAPDRLEIATTIEDPKVLTKPWTVVRPYLRHRDWTIQEYVCEQNNHDSADEQGRAGFRLDNDAPPAAPAH